MNSCQLPGKTTTKENAQVGGTFPTKSHLTGKERKGTLFKCLVVLALER